MQCVKDPVLNPTLVLINCHSFEWQRLKNLKIENKVVFMTDLLEYVVPTVWVL